jgi:hypothetical protein
MGSIILPASMSKTVFAASRGFFGNSTFSNNSFSSLKASMPKEHSISVAFTNYPSAPTNPRFVFNKVLQLPISRGKNWESEIERSRRMAFAGLQEPLDSRLNLQ